jgi:hypothetical protein
MQGQVFWIHNEVAFLERLGEVEWHGVDGLRQMSGYVLFDLFHGMEKKHAAVGRLSDAQCKK